MSLTSINWYTAGFQVNINGSGLGFFGDSGFSAPVAVNAYQGRTYITNANGTSRLQEGNNIKYLNDGSGIIGQAGSGIALTAIPNWQNTVQIRSSFATAVRVTAARLYGYDRVSLSNPPSGVTLKSFEGIHPDTTQANNGSGDTTWLTLAGTGSYLNLCPSPGVSGLYAGNGSNSTWNDTVHDHYCGLSISPQTIGSKTQVGLAVEIEYL